MKLEDLNTNIKTPTDLLKDKINHSSNFSRLYLALDIIFNQNNTKSIKIKDLFDIECFSSWGNGLLFRRVDTLVRLGLLHKDNRKKYNNYVLNNKLLFDKDLIKLAKEKIGIE